MSKVKDLKRYIKTYPEIFNRIVSDYKLNSPSSFIHEYLDYNSDKGSLRIALVSNRMIKVLKQEGDTKTVEIVRLIGEEPTATERIRKEPYRENIKRKSISFLILDLLNYLLPVLYKVEKFFVGNYQSITSNNHFSFSFFM